MLDLNDFSRFDELDSHDRLGQIGALAAHLSTAWELGLWLPLPETTGLRQIVLAGMGDSALGGELLAAYSAPSCRMPLALWREDGLPAWAAGPQTLVILSSHSGQTEETVSAFEQAQQRGCRLLALSSGGEIAQRAEAGQAALWRYPQQTLAVSLSYSFALPLALLARLGLIPDPAGEIAAAVKMLQTQAVQLGPQSPLTANPAKRIAGQMLDRWPAIFGGGLLAPVARRWKTQINLQARAWAQFEPLPEAAHNTLAGRMFPEEQLPRALAMFLTASSQPARQQQLNEQARTALMLEGIGTDMMSAPDGPPLAQQWALLQFGDYVACYLALLYGVDPS